MTEFSQCPRCGWPQGPTHSWEVVATPYGCEWQQVSAPLAPQGQDDWERNKHFVGLFTDAKEGEEDGTPVPSTNNSLGNGILPSDTAPLVTAPDIAGLVERLRKRKEFITTDWAHWYMTTRDDEDCLEAADALEIVKAERDFFNSCIDVLQAELTAAKAEIEELKADMMRFAYSPREKEVTALQAELAAAKAEIEELKFALEYDRPTFAELQADYNAAKAENKANATAYCETEAELTKVRDELEAAQAEIADADHLADLQQREIKGLRAALEKIANRSFCNVDAEIARAALGGKHGKE